MSDLPWIISGTPTIITEFLINGRQGASEEGGTVTAAKGGTLCPGVEACLLLGV